MTLMSSLDIKSVNRTSRKMSWRGRDSRRNSNGYKRSSLKKKRRRMKKKIHPVMSRRRSS